jgi:hypothetical protein
MLLDPQIYRTVSMTARYGKAARCLCEVGRDPKAEVVVERVQQAKTWRKYIITEWMPAHPETQGIKPIRTSWKQSIARRLEAQIREIDEAFETLTDASTTDADASDGSEFETDDPLCQSHDPRLSEVCPRVVRGLSGFCSPCVRASPREVSAVGTHFAPPPQLSSCWRTYSWSRADRVASWS